VKRVASGLLMAMALGCTTAPADKGEPEVRERGAGRCDAAAAQRLVGRERSDALGAEAMRVSGAARLRWIAPGMMVTMEYREDRLNLHLGPDGRVLKIACG